MTQCFSGIGCKGSCVNCNSCNCFHKVLSAINVTDLSILLEVTNNSNVKRNDNFCFVFPCGIDPAKFTGICYFNLNGNIFKLKGALGSDFKRRKLYKATVKENNLIKLSPLVKF